MSDPGFARSRPWTGLDAVTVLAPTSPGQDLAGFLGATLAAGSGEPFAAERREAIHALSAAFLADPVLRRDAASVAAAYWMRRAQE
jgi:hypothetical protein